MTAKKEPAPTLGLTEIFAIGHQRQVGVGRILDRMAYAVSSPGPIVRKYKPVLISWCGRTIGQVGMAD